MQSIIEGDDDGHATASTFGKHSAIVIKNSTDLIPDLQKELEKPYQARGQLLGSVARALAKDIMSFMTLSLLLAFYSTGQASKHRSAFYRVSNVT